MATTSIAGGGNHNITVYGNGSVSLGDGNNAVRLGSGSVMVGNGSDTINVSGNGFVVAGSGNDIVNMLGAGQISVGGGNDSLSMYGSGMIVETGAMGHDTINVGTGNNTITVEGNATVQAAGQSPRFGFNHGTFGHGVLGARLGQGVAGGATIAGGGSLLVQHMDSGTQDIAISGAMTLLGSSAYTSFVGGSGSTVMKGISGQDTFFGGSGHDTMTGSGSDNVFEFLASAAGGQHVITNFVPGDQLLVEGQSLSALMANHQVTTLNGNTYIVADGGTTTIELQGVVTFQNGAVKPPLAPTVTGLGHPHGLGSGGLGSGLNAHDPSDVTRHIGEPKDVR